VAEKDAVTIRVEDSGSGIPDEAKPQIFDRFYRVDKARSRKAGGAGLGLSIVHDMVLRNRGTISVEDRPGGGTIFVLVMPTHQAEEEAKV
jgi:signal transduction histidine kinase